MLSRYAVCIVYTHVEYRAWGCLLQLGSLTVVKRVGIDLGTSVILEWKAMVLMGGNS